MSSAHVETWPINYTTTTVPNDTYDTNDTYPSNITIGYTCSMDSYVLLSLAVYPYGIFVILVLALLPRPRQEGGLFGVHHRSSRCLRGCIYPINMLDGYDHRVGYACIFGAMTVQLVDLLTKRYTLSGGIAFDDLFKYASFYTPAFQILMVTLNVALVTFAFYPLFICFTTEHKFAGSIFGLIGAAYRFCVKLWTVISCQSEEDPRFVVATYEPLFYNIPSLLFLAILCSVFCSILAKCIDDGKFGFCPKERRLAEDHHILHVRRLFGAMPLPWHEDHMPHLSILARQKFRAVCMYKPLPYFKFPTRLVATFTIMAAGLYQIGLLVIFTVYSIIKTVQIELRSMDLAVLDTIKSYELTPYLPAVIKYIGYAANLWIIVTCLTCAMAVVYLYHTSICYRRHIYRLYRGDRQIFPSSFMRQDNPNIMTNAVRYAGLQIAYFMWGFVLIQLAFFLIAALIVFVIFVPMIDYGYYSIVRTLAEAIIVPIIINIAIYYAQVIATRMAFLQPKLSPADKKLPLAVNNRHAFYNFSLFFFFWNIFLGIVSAIMRVVKGMLLGIFLIPRIDRSVMMRGYESMDGGFMCYLGVLSVINAHDHPVLKVFLKVLKESADQRQVTQLGKNRDSTQMKSESRVSRKARHNWFIAYTLLHNPELIAHRKTHDKLADTARHLIMVAVRNKRGGGCTSQLYCDAENVPLRQRSGSTEELNMIA